MSKINSYVGKLLIIVNKTHIYLFLVLCLSEAQCDFQLFLFNSQSNKSQISDNTPKKYLI